MPISLTPTEMQEEQEQKMAVIQEKLKPLLAKLNRGFHDFLSEANGLRLRRVAKVTGVSLEKLLTCQEIIRDWRFLGLTDPDLHLAQDHMPGEVPNLLRCIARTEQRINEAFSRL